MIGIKKIFLMLVLVFIVIGCDSDNQDKKPTFEFEPIDLSLIYTIASYILNLGILMCFYLMVHLNLVMLSVKI